METLTYKENAKKMIDDLFVRIDELEKNKDKVQHMAAEKRDQLLEELKTRKSELQAKYETLKNAPEDKWDQAKDSFKVSVDYFKDGLSRLVSDN